MKKKKIKNLSSTIVRPLVDDRLIARLRQLLEYVPPARLKKELFQVFLIFMEHEHESLPLNFRQIVTDYYMLFDFLDEADATMSGRT